VLVHVRLPRLLSAGVSKKMSQINDAEKKQNKINKRPYAPNIHITKSYISVVVL
jgi:hypothetical protein